jgi:hypothetical protein
LTLLFKPRIILASPPSRLPVQKSSHAQAMSLQARVAVAGDTRKHTSEHQVRAIKLRDFAGLRD